MGAIRKRQGWSEVSADWQSTRDTVKSGGGGTGNTAEGRTLAPREAGARWGRRETDGKGMRETPLTGFVSRGSSCWLVFQHEFQENRISADVLN